MKRAFIQDGTDTSRLAPRKGAAHWHRGRSPFPDTPELAPGWFISSVFLAVVLVTSIATGAVRYVETDAVPIPTLRSYLASGHRLEFTDSGRLLMSGPFAEVNGVPRGGFARLQADGQLDTSYTAASEFTRNSAAYQPWRSDGAGRVYFFAMGATASTASVRRLAADGTLDATYKLEATLDAPASGERPYLSTLIAGGGGRTLVGGRFDKLGGVAVKDWAFLQADGSVDAAFHLLDAESLRAIVPMDDGRWIVVTVRFPTDTTRVPYVPTIAISRLLADGSLDASFTPYVTTEVVSSGGPHAFAFDDGGRLVFAENVTTGTSPVSLITRLGRLGTDGRRDETFGPVLPTIMENVLPYAQSAEPSTATEGGAASDALVYVPPHVRQIVPDGAGNLLCVAPFADASYGGIARVVGDDAVGKSGFAVDADKTAQWLRRDSAGRWWMELVQNPGGAMQARPVRLLASGEIDPVFSVATLAGGQASTVFALPGGAVALEGYFDLADGVARPGVAVVEANRALRPMEAVPWRKARIISVLGDGGLLLNQVTSGGIIFLAASGGGASVSGATKLVRLFPDGTLLGLLTDSPNAISAQRGWLDRDGHLFLLSPGAAFRKDLPADLVRLKDDGTVDPTFSPSSPGGSSGLIEQACPDADAVGAWTLRWTTGTRRLTHLAADGSETATIALQPARDDGSNTWTSDIAPAADGVFVAGRFDQLNRVRSPGVARVHADGTVDAAWGGGLRAGSAAFVVQRHSNGVVFVGGDLVAKSGAADAVLLDADGLRIPGAPQAKQSQLSASPDGAWAALFERYATTPATSVRRWHAVSVFEPPLTAPTGAVHLGDTVVLRVDWMGVPLMGISWWRDGVLIADANGPAYSFVPTTADDGAVFYAMLTFEGGSVLSTRSWRLVLDGPHARMINGSIRAIGGVGEQTLIIGCDLAGLGRDAVLVRGLGPALGELGVSSAARSASVAMMRSSGTVVMPPADYVWARNTVGGVHPDVVAASRSVAAYKPDALFLSGNDQMLYPAPGCGLLHVHVAPRAPGDAGVLLGELFSISNASDNLRSTWLRNFSGRASVRSGGGVLIGGFVIDGDRALRVLVRGVGPGLAPFGVAGVSRDPRLTIFSGQTSIAANDNWDANPADAQAIIDASVRALAFALEDGSRDAAIVVSLAPGIYTAVISADADAEGVALLEVYALD